MKIRKFDDDFGAILNAAVRYSLGRRTYMPGLVTDWIRDHCGGELNRKTLDVFIQDIEEHGKRGPEAYGDSWDLETWMGFLEWCKREKENQDNEQRWPSKQSEASHG